MSAKVHDPITPGEILLTEFLEPLGISQYRLAQATGLPQTRISEIVHGRRRITPDTGQFSGRSRYRFKNLQFYTARSTARAEARRLNGSPSIWWSDLLAGQVEKLSPPHRGTTWKCRCGTDCSELGPLALRILTPSAPRAERITSATRLTSAIDWARTCGAASKISVTCAVGTTRVWPGAIGVSGAKAHVVGPRVIHVAVSSCMRRQKTQSMVPDVLRSRPGETRYPCRDRSNLERSNIGPDQPRNNESG